MIDPLTLFIGGGIWLAFKEINKKDYGVLTPERDERYRNSMEYCYQPEQLLQEAKVFYEFGLKAEAAMLKRRSEWRARSDDVKKAHEDIYKKALASKNIPGILEVAAAFEGWTATKKAANLRDHVRELQESALQVAAQRAADSVHKDTKGGNGAAKDIPQNTDVEVLNTGDDI